VIPDRIIDDLRRREVGGLIEPHKAPRFRPGDKVRITRRAWADHLGIFVGIAAALHAPPMRYAS
jgi:hypothetical protein